MKRFEPAASLLVIVDIQERLSQVMPEARLADVKRAAEILLEAAQLWEMPVLLTEQYPKGLGPTIASIAERLQNQAFQRIEKLEFSACGSAEFTQHLAALPQKSCVVIGMEAHVCIFQTVRDLVQLDYRVWVPVDGVVSRRDDHGEAGLRLCEAAGATLTTTETLVFDGLVRAGTPEFRRLSALIR